MYSYEDRMKAVMLYIEYDRSAADTIRELGYPGRKMLVRWYREYEATGKYLSILPSCRSLQSDQGSARPYC